MIELCAQASLLACLIITPPAPPADPGAEAALIAQAATHAAADADTTPQPYTVPEPWATLADCESGDWLNRGAAFVPGSARWQWGHPEVPVPPWGTRLHHGGLQHHPDTWRWVAGDLGLLDDYPHAYDAPPAVQIEVATEVQARQGWAAWPVCSRKVGLR